MSKFSIDVLNKYVHPYITSDDPDVIMGPVFGEDVAITRVGDGYLVSHVDPIVGAVKDIGWLAVHVACNDIATSGSKPRWIQILLLVPRMEDEVLVGEIMSDINRAAKEIGVSIIGGHTGYSANLSRPLVSITALGILTNQKPIYTGGAKVGDHIFITKGIALEGTAILANDFSKIALEKGLSHQNLDDARKLMNGVSIVPEAMILSEIGASSMHDVTRGGLQETLVEMAKLSNFRFQILSDHILIPDIVKRFSQAFGFEPMKMISSGSLAATIPADRVHEAEKTLNASGILYADIGEVVNGAGVEIITHGESKYYDEIKCEEDELARMWEIYADMR